MGAQRLSTTQRTISSSFLASFALFPLWLRPCNQVGEIDLRKTSIMKDLTAALASMTLNKESYIKNRAILHQEARDGVEVFQSPSSVYCCLHKLTTAVQAWSALSKINFFWSNWSMGGTPCSSPHYVWSQTSEVLEVNFLTCGLAPLHIPTTSLQHFPVPSQKLEPAGAEQRSTECSPHLGISVLPTSPLLRIYLRLIPILNLSEVSNYF